MNEDLDLILRVIRSGATLSVEQGKLLRDIYQVDRDVARIIVRAALEAQNGNWTQAAKQLSTGRRTIWRWKAENGWDNIGAGLPNAKLGRVVNM